MPVHNRVRAPSGYFRHFHQQWTGSICNALNGGLLPRGFFALVEQREDAGAVPDVLALQRQLGFGEPPDMRGGLAVAVAPPKARFISRATDEDVFAARANRVVVRESRGKIVSVIEIVSPGNKSSRHALRTVVDKAVGLLGQGINLLVIDLLPPSTRDPQGLHKPIWDEIREEPFELPVDKPLTLAAYSVGPPKTAYVEPVAVGDVLPAMPAFLGSELYVLVPLEQTYEATWAACPEEFKEAVE